jgi:hypothetical protein
MVENNTGFTYKDMNGAKGVDPPQSLIYIRALSVVTGEVYETSEESKK